MEYVVLVVVCVYRIWGKAKKDFPGLFGYLVVFPRGEVVGNLPESKDRELLVRKSAMPKLAERIESAFEKRGDSARGKLFNEGVMKKVVEFFEDNCRICGIRGAAPTEWEGFSAFKDWQV